MAEKNSRKDDILQALAKMLEDSPGGRITTAGLAKEVGVSEAALYRHFPSKARMFEGLITFIEDSVFGRLNGLVDNKEMDSLSKCENLIGFMLVFSERNPGISRLLNGDALTGETERLRARIHQFYEKLETQIKQILRDAEFSENQRTQLTPTQTANLLVAFVEGKVSQFVRSGFERKPSAEWQEQWNVLAGQIYR